jgi:hypothetical protein
VNVRRPCPSSLTSLNWINDASIEAARTVRRFPIILEMLGQGSVNLTTVNVLAAHLSEDNHREVLKEARHKNKRQIEELRARLDPQPPVPSSVRRLPTSHAGIALAEHKSPPAVNPAMTANPQNPQPFRL